MRGFAYATIVAVMNTLDREGIAAEVRAAMARERVTTKDMARRIGVSRVALSERLNGTRPFNTDQLIAICGVLSVDFLSLFPDTSGDKAASA